MIADEAKKIGIIIKVVPYEYSVYLKKLQSHDFDLHYSALSTSQNPSDFKENFSTRAWSDGGINYSGFGTAKTDLLIDSIRQELDENKRNILVKRFQEIVADECPAIYLYNVQNMMAVHKRFRNADPYPVRPYYFAQRFWVPKNLTRYVSDEPGN
jgi:ABC-type transport system substrate-binding protein